MKENSVFGYTIASKSDRFLANLFQTFIFILFVLFISWVFNISILNIVGEESSLLEVLWSGLAGAIVGIIFYPRFCGNLGHRILKIKVISAETGIDYNNAKEGALREFLKNVLGYLFIPSIWILWDDKNQNLYDKITKTYVVYVKN
ncbi:RDD family protein [Lutibacter sp. TH_r2]|uniref:RDD family protein n=1 Tax=Lutibacter sp. TH_r2 TaxID=3082083 RepID=UPI002955C727|nr:RDD family protein [Lutibacter sp. TH_r2]MDV7187415.1 RDD family protein [Lutibacter sp. TH_r2]